MTKQVFDDESKNARDKTEKKVNKQKSERNENKRKKRIG